MKAGGPPRERSRERAGERARDPAHPGPGDEPPFIAVTASVRDSEIGLPQTVLEVGYARAVRVAGGLLLVLSPALDAETIAALFEKASGLLLTGGEDIDPGRYGQEKDGCRRIAAERDALEIGLAERAIARGMPVLALCRGLQLLNVMHGGTLYQDLVSRRRDSADHDRYREFAASIHMIHMEPDSRLAGIYPADPFPQNSAHHQGIDELGDGLRVIARAEDGVIEAIELEASEPWVVGVQWHPERRLDEAAGGNRRLFERFGEQVASFASGVRTESLHAT